MTKSEYLKIRELSEIPMESWYQFFLDNGGSEIGIGEFTRIFSTFTWNASVVRGSMGLKQIKYGDCVQKFYEYYNQKFGLDN